MSETTQPPVRTRSRLAATPPASGATSVGQGVKPVAQWGRRGAEADADAQAEQRRREAEAEARRAQNVMPRRWELRAGETAELIVLEDDLGMQINEHQKWHQQWRRMVYESCCGEWAHCVLCDDAKAGEDRSRHGFRRSNKSDVLTVLDLRQFEVQHGPDAGKVIPASRKLMALNYHDRNRFKALLQEHGTLRGLRLVMRRPTKEDSRIGLPEYVETWSEDDLLNEPLLDDLRGEYRNDKGQVIRAEGDIIRPFDLLALFPQPNPRALLARYGGQAPAGSAADNDSEWGRHDPGQAGANTVDNIPLGGGTTQDEAPAGRREPVRRRTPLQARPSAASSAGQDDPNDGRFAPPAGLADDDDVPF